MRRMGQEEKRRKDAKVCRFGIRIGRCQDVNLESAAEAERRGSGAKRIEGRSCEYLTIIV